MGKHGDSIEYAGVKWHPRQDGYYQNKYRGLLHRFMWEEANGPIPDGMQVHHRNHNKRDNRVDNFVLVTPGEHWREHGDERGADWHSLGGKAGWIDKPYRTVQCTVCGEDFTTRATVDPKYCSKLCRHRAPRPQEERVCVVCSARFSTRAGTAARTCSRKCTATHAYAQRGKGL